MNTIEKIYDKNQICLSILIRAEYCTEKTEFFSNPEYSQQIGIISYPGCGKIKPHYHNKVSREVIYTQEVLIIRKGSIRVDLYNNDLSYNSSHILKKGDTIFLVSGGHGFEMLEDCEMLEIKQGPYNGINNDKTHFEGVLNDSGK